LSLLRDSFAGINARFHLVGLGTVVNLLLLIGFSAANKAEELAPLVFGALFVALGVSFAIQGLTYHAAIDPPGRKAPSPVRLGLLLFPTLLWLQARLFLCYVVPYLLAIGGYAAVTHALPGEAWGKQADLWIRCLVQVVVPILSTAATPLAIRLREHSQRGRPIRDGLRFFAAHRREAALILVVIGPAAILGAAVELMLGSEATDPVPHIPEAFAMFLGSYLELVALFAASRVMALAFVAKAGDADRAANPSAAGPAA
jgi:hypothetical protein